ncbi:MAG TPA: peptidylprolyl isomerase [Sphingomicrobium sp.]
MIARVLLSLSALALVAAADPTPPPATPAKPALSINPPAEILNDPSNRLTLDLSTGQKVVVILRPDAAPAHVERIKTLVRQGFYDGLTFHRVIPGFMAQGGDPKGTGEGGSSLPDLKAEFNSLPFLRGTVGAARADNPDSANSQFFIMFGPKIEMNGKYTVFGRVAEGMAAVDGIATGEPPEQPTKIVHASLGGQ